MTPLPEVPVPPQLESAIGYGGDAARWVSLCWTCCGDTCWLDDGRSSLTGNGYGFLAWVRHPAVQPHLLTADLGSSERDGSQRLVVDRQERKVYLADADEARRVVTGQWPAEPGVELTPAEWAAVVELVREQMLNRPMPSLVELMRQLKHHSRLVAEMVAWLDEWRAGRSGSITTTTRDGGPTR